MLAKVFLCLLGVAFAMGKSSDVSIAGTGYQDDQSDEAIRAYWTPDRMARASRVSILPTGEKVENHGPMLQANLDKAKPVRGITFKTIGKIFYTSVTDGTDATATGVVIDSKSQRLVATTAHVIYPAKTGAFNKNFLFVPGYEYNDRPYGTYTSSNALVTTVWAETADLRYNFGAVIASRFEGKNITQVTGGQAMAFNTADNGFVYQVGYPTGPGFGGEEQFYCSGNTFTASDRIIGLKCNQRLGSFGAPLLINVDNSTGLGQVVGLYSHSLAAQPDNTYSPYFEKEAEAFYGRND